MQVLKIGDKLRAFSLKGVDGKLHSISEYSRRKVLVVVFLSNVSTVSQAYESRLIKLQDHFMAKSVQFIAINPNDPNYALRDSFYRMVDESMKKDFNFPYLKDDHQKVAHYFDAISTPEVFVFDKDRILKYRGKIDDNWNNPSAVKKNYLAEAIKSVLHHHEIKVPETIPVGQTIKWNY